MQESGTLHGPGPGPGRLRWRDGRKGGGAATPGRSPAHARYAFVAWSHVYMSFYHFLLPRIIIYYFISSYMIRYCQILSHIIEYYLTLSFNWNFILHYRITSYHISVWGGLVVHLRDSHFNLTLLRPLSFERTISVDASQSEPRPRKSGTCKSWN